MANALNAPPARDDRPPRGPSLPPRNEASAKGPFSFFALRRPQDVPSPTHATISSRGQATSAVARARLPPRRLGSRTRTTPRAAITASPIAVASGRDASVNPTRPIALVAPLKLNNQLQRMRGTKRVVTKEFVVPGRGRSPGPPMATKQTASTVEEHSYSSGTGVPKSTDTEPATSAGTVAPLSITSLLWEARCPRRVRCLPSALWTKQKRDDGSLN